MAENSRSSGEQSTERNNRYAQKILSIFTDVLGVRDQEGLENNTIFASQAAMADFQAGFNALEKLYPNIHLGKMPFMPSLDTVLTDSPEKIAHDWRTTAEETARVMQLLQKEDDLRVNITAPIRNQKGFQAEVNTQVSPGYDGVKVDFGVKQGFFFNTLNHFNFWIERGDEGNHVVKITELQVDVHELYKKDQGKLTFFSNKRSQVYEALAVGKEGVKESNKDVELAITTFLTHLIEIGGVDPTAKVKFASPTDMYWAKNNNAASQRMRHQLFKEVEEKNVQKNETGVMIGENELVYEDSANAIAAHIKLSAQDRAKIEAKAAEIIYARGSTLGTREYWDLVINMMVEKSGKYKKMFDIYPDTKSKNAVFKGVISGNETDVYSVIQDTSWRLVRKEIEDIINDTNLVYKEKLQRIADVVDFYGTKMPIDFLDENEHSQSILKRLKPKDVHKQVRDYVTSLLTDLSAEDDEQDDDNGNKDNKDDKTDGTPPPSRPPKPPQPPSTPSSAPTASSEGQTVSDNNTDATAGATTSSAPSSGASSQSTNNTETTSSTSNQKPDANVASQSGGQVRKTTSNEAKTFTEDSSFVNTMTGLLGRGEWEKLTPEQQENLRQWYQKQGAGMNRNSIAKGAGIPQGEVSHYMTEIALGMQPPDKTNQSNKNNPHSQKTDTVLREAGMSDYDKAVATYQALLKHQKEADVAFRKMQEEERKLRNTQKTLEDRANDTKNQKKSAIAQEGVHVINEEKQRNSKRRRNLYRSEADIAEGLADGIFNALMKTYKGDGDPWDIFWEVKHAVEEYINGKIEEPHLEKIFEKHQVKERIGEKWWNKLLGTQSKAKKIVTEQTAIGASADVVKVSNEIDETSAQVEEKVRSAKEATDSWLTQTARTVVNKAKEVDAAATDVGLAILGFGAKATVAVAVGTAIGGVKVAQMAYEAATKNEGVPDSSNYTYDEPEESQGEASEEDTEPDPTSFAGMMQNTKQAAEEGATEREKKKAAEAEASAHAKNVWNGIFDQVDETLGNMGGTQKVMLTHQLYNKYWDKLDSDDEAPAAMSNITDAIESHLPAKEAEPETPAQISQHSSDEEDSPNADYSNGAESVSPAYEESSGGYAGNDDWSGDATVYSDDDTGSQPKTRRFKRYSEISREEAEQNPDAEVHMDWRPTRGTTDNREQAGKNPDTVGDHRFNMSNFKNVLNVFDLERGNRKTQEKWDQWTKEAKEGKNQAEGDPLVNRGGEWTVSEDRLMYYDEGENTLKSIQKDKKKK